MRGFKRGVEEGVVIRLTCGAKGGDFIYAEKRKETRRMVQGRHAPVAQMLQVAVPSPLKARGQFKLPLLVPSTQLHPSLTAVALGDWYAPTQRYAAEKGGTRSARTRPDSEKRTGKHDAPN